MKRWGLRTRFLLLLVGVLVTVFAAVTFVIVRQNTATLRAGLVDQSKSFAAQATRPIGDSFLLYKDSGTIRIQQQIDHFTDLNPDINQVEIVDTSAKRLFTSNPAHPLSVNPAAASALSPSYRYGKHGNLAYIVQPYLENFGTHRYNLVYGVSYASVDQ